MLDFLLNEKKEGRIRNLGWSFHGDLKVFDYLLQLHDQDRVKWDFVQIQMNFVDWKHASGWNINAEYLYGELAKRNISVVIMEPLLGGRLSTLNNHLISRLKQRRPEDSIASWSFRFAGTYPHVLTVLSGIYGTSAGQCPYLFSLGPMYGGRTDPAGRYGGDDAEISHGALHHLRVLHALPLRIEHSRHLCALQPLRERRKRAGEFTIGELPSGAPCLPGGL